MPRPSSLNAVLLGALSCGTALLAQQQPEPSFRVSTDLVVIDLVAVDRSGRFVADLRPEEIEVEEDGRRQSVQLLRVIDQATPPNPVAAPVPSAGSPADTPAAAAAATGERVTPAPRRLAIVVDALSLSVDAIPRIRESLLQTLSDVPDGIPVLLATIGPDLHIRQPFTTDKAALRTAVSAFTAQLDPPAGIGRVFDAVDRMCAAAVDQARVLEVALEAGELLIADAQARSAVTSEALAILATRLGLLAGRKHLVLYSSGHAVSPVTQAVDAVAAAAAACTGRDPMVVRREASRALGIRGTRAATEGLRHVIQQANRSQITFYTLDPAGITTAAIMPVSRGAARSGGTGALVALPGLRADAGRDYVQSLALETGGLTIASNDLALVLRRAWEDAREYYLVGYAAPPATSKGDLRTITVSVKRSGVTVRYRRGYLAPSAPLAAPSLSAADREIEAAFASPSRFASEGIVVSPSVENETLSVEVLVPRASIAFSETSGKHQADFSVHALLRPAKPPGSHIDVPGKDIALRLTPEEFARITAGNTLRVVLTTAAPKGAHVLTVVVRDSSGWLATREMPCCAPASVKAADVPGASDVLMRAAGYVDAFVSRFSNVVLEEALTQTYTAAPSTLGGRSSRALSPGTTTKRRLLSEFLLVRPPSTVFWLSFRDVVEVDGQPVVDRRDRLEQLFLKGTRSGLAEAQQVAAASTRFLLGRRTRTTTSPVFALAFLQSHHQPRFRYVVDASRGRAPAGTLTLRAQEVQEPTLLRTDTGGSLPLHGRYEVDPVTGVVHASEVTVRTMGERLVLRTRFGFDERTQTFVPTEMTEEHVLRDGARLVTVARYGRVRSFSVSTSEAVP